MNGGVSGPFIRHPIATSLIMIGFLFVGIIAYPLLPVADLPQVDFPTIVVTASLPGASPETMASSVAQPLERRFAQIPGVAQMTSSSMLGSTSVTLQFDLSRDIDAAANDVQAAINEAGGQLPKNLPNPPVYRKVNPADAPVLLLSATSNSMPIFKVDDAIDTKIAQQVSQIPGVAQVIIGGEQQPALRIQLDPAKLAAKGLSLEAVRTALSSATVDAPKGEIEGPTRSYAIYANDQLTKAAQWNNVIVAYRNGAPIRVSDIGQAVEGPADTTQEAWANGKRGVFLVIFKQPGANVISTVDQIMKELPRLKAALPPAIHISVLSDRTKTIRSAIQEVQFTLLITIALVVMVIFLFLRSIWATLIPSITVPLALLGACALMWGAGYSLDNLSLMALTISVGFVVDDAIVMLENITRHIEEGARPLEAALKGAGEIGFTILSISLSLVAVLIPLLLMGGIIGRLFREFAVTLTMAIAVSAVVSLTLTPTMAARFLRARSEVHHGRIFNASERAFNALIAGYERMLDHVLAWRRVTLTVFLCTIVATVYLFMIIPKGFFPQQDTGLIIGTSVAAQDISVADMAKHQEALGAIVQKDPDVASIAMAMGGGFGGALNTGRMFITLKPREDRKATADQIIARLRPKLAKVEGAKLYLQAAQDVRVGGRPTRTQYEFTLQDSSISELNTWAPKVLAKLRGLPELRDVATDQENSGTTLTLTINHDQAARYGIQPQLIDDTLDDAFGQRLVAQYFTQLNTYPVIMEITPALQGQVDSLQQIYLTSPVTGGQVPLSAIATWTTKPVQPLSIAHQGQFPAITISFNLAQGVALGQATQAIAQARQQLHLPDTLSARFQGTAQAFQESLTTVPLLIGAAIVVVYLILGVLYESYIHPITILSTIPSAGLGALSALMLGGFDFSLIALIGIILLIGIVKKNGIMLVDFAIVAEREEGLSSLEAIRKAALLRFRPIMMTTMAALLGALPLMLARGTGSELRQPLGWAMVGGLMVSQALTLFTTPVVYLYLDGLAHRLTGRRRVARDAEPGAADEVWPTKAAAE